MKFVYYCALLSGAVAGETDSVTPNYVAEYTPAYPGYPSYPTDPYNPYPPYPSYPPYPTWPTPSWWTPPTPSWPSWPSWPPTPSWPSNPGSGGSCWSHSQCGGSQYCYSCSTCRYTPGCYQTSVCRSNPYGGECAPIANCQRDNDSIDGRCPSGGSNSGSCWGVSCPYGQRCVPEFYGHRCEPSYGGDSCSPNPCPRGQRCVPKQIYCITMPCPQYECVPRGGGGGGNCQANEEYTNCGSSSCWEESCENSEPWPPAMCTEDCKSGCRCKPGYKRGYNGQCIEYCYVLGRPFSLEKGGFLVAPVMSSPSITIEEIVAVPENASSFEPSMPEADRTKAAQYWSKVAMMEHASVASFSRFSLELMSIGAPVDLLSGAHQAAMDEVRHTQVSLDIANQFGSGNFTPGSFPISREAADFAFGDVEKIAEAAALEGCIEETLAAAVVFEQARAMQIPSLKAQIRSVGLDEANHAAFAWRAVQWMTSTFPQTQQVVAKVFATRAAKYKDTPDNTAAPAPSSLQHLGLLDSATVSAVQASAWRRVVVPAAVKLGFLEGSATPLEPNAIVEALAGPACNAL